MKKYIPIIVLLLSAISSLQAQTFSDDNLIYTSRPKKPVQAGAYNTLTKDEVSQSVTYFDGLGRPVQSIAISQGAAGQDIITPIEYDGLGRQAKDYLPYASSNGGTSYPKIDPATAINAATMFYNTDKYENTSNPFSEKKFEASPLNRLLKQAAPGTAWTMDSGHEIKLDYQTNVSSDAVKLFKATTSWNADSGLYDIVFSDEGTYGEKTLYKNVTYDENTAAGSNAGTEEFKNKEGQVVLKRTYEGDDKHDTYYVYDLYGNLTYVIPPKADGVVSDEVLNGLCYQYKYDYRNRLVEKKLPGKQWEFIVYDRLDRPVATGPAFSPFKDDTAIGWLITKYDAYGRPIYTGWISQPVSSGTRNLLQTAQNTTTGLLYETKEASGTIDGIAAYYSNAIAPTTFKLLTVNYYDDYSFPNAQVIPSTVESQNVLANAKGLLTGSWTRALSTAASIAGETNTTIYDVKARPVGNYTQNHLGGYTYTESNLDFGGKTLYSISRHKRTSGDTELTIKEVFTYSPQDRLLTHTHQINGGVIQLMADNTYDELGQLMSKNVGNSTGSPLQKVNFNYNIRGWLTEINKTADLQQGTDAKDLFAFKINYNTTEAAISGVTGLYNGNISEILWKTGSDAIDRGYGYKYDNLNRLKNAIYEKSSLTTNAYDENLTYDKNGNIISLIRKGDIDPQVGIIEIDNLAYTYPADSNQLVKVTDNANNTSGFNDVNKTGDDYTYDANGNMITDKNKNITAIAYNQLNLPKKITFGTSGTIEYIYNAAGQKLEKIVTEGTVTTNTNYLGGFQYKNNVLEFFPTAEGYVKNTGGMLSYVFQYKDHLGNIRLSYAKNPTTQVLEIIEENNYYPFGLKHKGYNDYVATGNKYKYNGKELQDELGLGMYDYGFRNYDPALGRWMNIDPLAEMSRRWSPYTYCYNNPVFFIDPDGMLATYDWDAHNSGRKGVYKDGDKEVSFEEAKASHGISTPKQEQYKKGDYVAVVNAPKGAGGFGHNALLVGNDDTGWVFISKEGRDEDENSNSGNNPLTGGRALDARKESFATINDFFADRDYSEYKEGVVIKIQSSTAEKGEKEMTKQALSKYSLIFNNCGQAVNETLNKLGIRTVDPDKYKVYGGYSAGAALYNGVVPNEMYYSVKQANKNVPRTILSRK
jgi:RHS repeat-associated protein